jgi:hypothetical protein
MEELLQAADSKNPDEILNALDKVKSAKKERKTSLNLGRKVTEPVNGFNLDVK